MDDFNDGTITGWTTQAGSVSEGGGTFSGTSLSLATFDGASGSVAAVDAATSGSSSAFVAVVQGFTSLTNNLFVKIQDNNSNGLFDRVFFYRGNNGAGSSNGLVGQDFFDLTNEVARTNFEVEVTGTTVTATVGATGDMFSGTLVDTYAGTGVGLGFFGVGEADDFYLGGDAPAPIPLPAFALLLAASL